jgi:hypothetical protein
VTLPGRAATLALALAAMLALSVAACDSGSATPSAAAPTIAPTAEVPATPAGSPTPQPTPLPSGAAVALDASLLGILPATIAGATVTSEADSFAQAIKDPTFIANVDRAAFAVVVNGNDLASGVVAHLRPSVYSAAFWKDWRETYDSGACGQAGGVLARASSTIGGREIFVTTCAGGLRVYQVWLSGPGVVVSLFSVGDRKFGEQLMAGLKG